MQAENVSRTLRDNENNVHQQKTDSVFTFRNWRLSLLRTSNRFLPFVKQQIASANRAKARHRYCDAEEQTHRRFFVPVSYELINKSSGVCYLISDLADIAEQSRKENLGKPYEFDVWAVFADGSKELMPPACYLRQQLFTIEEARAFYLLQKKREFRHQQFAVLTNLEKIRKCFVNGCYHNEQIRKEVQEIIRYSPSEWLSEHELAQQLQMRYGRLPAFLVKILAPIRFQVQKGDLSRRFYFFGLLFLVLTIIAPIFVVVFGKRAFESFFSLFFITISLIIIGFTVEATSSLIKVWQNKLFSVAVGVLALLISQVSGALTKHWINDLVGLNPNPFSSAFWFFSIITTIYAWSVIVLAVLFSIYLASVIWVNLFVFIERVVWNLTEMLINSEVYRFVFRSNLILERPKLDFVKFFGRGFAAFFVLAVLGAHLSYLWNTREAYKSLLVEGFVYLEFYSKTACSNVESGERVFELGENEIIVANFNDEGAVVFEKRQCDASASK